MPKELPWGVELVVQDVVDVMVPQNPQKPDCIEVHVLASVNWANHGTDEHVITQWPVEFHLPGLPPTTMGTFRRPLQAHPTNAGILMHEPNVSLVMWFEKNLDLPLNVTQQLLTEARMNFHRLPRNAGAVRSATPVASDEHVDVSPADLAPKADESPDAPEPVIAEPTAPEPIVPEPMLAEPFAPAPVATEPGPVGPPTDHQAPAADLGSGERRLIEVMRVLPVDLQHHLAGYAEGLAGRQQGVA